MDVERFRELYISGAKYTQIKKELYISFATINAYRIRLGLPKREKSYGRFEVDEELFLKLYHSKDHYYTYEEIANELGCCTSLIVTLRRRLNLPDREAKPRSSIDEEKFRQMYLDPNNTHDMICDEFNICVDTIRILKKKHNLPSRKQKSTYIESEFIEAYNSGLSNHKLASMYGMDRRTVAQRIQELGLPPRKNASSHEDDFRKAHASGMSITQLAEKFKISRSQVYVYMRKFRLSYVKESKNSVVEPLINPSEPVGSDEKVKAKECIKTKVTVPVKSAEVPEVHENRPHFTLPPPTLRQLEKRNQELTIQRAQRDYKILHKEHGFGSLIGQEIDDQITSPFSR